MTLADNRRAIVAMLAAMFFFVSNDTLVKLASASMPTGQIIFIRGAIATALITAIILIAARGNRFSGLNHWSVWARTVAEIGATLCYLTALFHLPIANVTAILQALPLAVTVAAVIFLGETVRWRRWTAIAVGFIGMLMIVRPGMAGFSAFAWYAVAAVGFIAARDILSRYIPAGTPTLSVVFATAAAVTVMGLVMARFEAWHMPSGDALGYVIGAALLLIGAYFSILVATRTGDMSAIAPFRYAILVMAIAYGWAIWGEFPDLLDFAGIVLIVGSGLYVFYREQWLVSKRSTETEAR